jgi:hypothetical protein
MATGWGVLVIGAAWLAWAACAQAQAATDGSRALVMISSGALSPEEARASAAAPDAGADSRPGEILREIDDPHNGDRWLLMRNRQAPGGPGRLVRVAVGRKTADGVRAQGAGAPLFAPVIRSGDRLIIEEHTALVDAVLEARALSPAMAGAAFDARLTMGGGVVRVVATGPGRASLAAAQGVRP